MQRIHGIVRDKINSEIVKNVNLEKGLLERPCKTNGGEMAMRSVSRSHSECLIPADINTGR